MTPEYELFAIRYATRTGTTRADFFMDGDSHETPMTMDYFIWLARSPERSFVIDTGFSEAMAARRKRVFLRSPKDGLALLGVDAGEVRDVIVTHLHYDHIGTFDDFAAARFHLQDDEMAYATGRYMRHARFNRSYEVEDVVGMVRLAFKDRIVFHAGTAELAPGISIHRIGGHTRGLQCVRVWTARGWVVLASDASQFYEHIATSRCGHTAFDLGEVFDGYDVLRMLADSADHIIPGHDPEVLTRYPAAAPSLEGVAVRLDLPPRA